jgi:hypothetical protein
MSFNFYIGLDDIYYAWRFDKCFLCINRMRDRKKSFRVENWIMDSGAFMELKKHGRFRHEPEEYAADIERWKSTGTMEIAVSQDYMCESFILEITGLTVAEHQRLTIERYDRLRIATDAPLMPVLQGFHPNDYLRHLTQYGERLAQGMRVGVGSVCKRNSHPAVIEYILRQIKNQRPDLRLHGFGLKLTALQRPEIRTLLYSADSMAWSDAERKAAQQVKLKLSHELHRKLTPKESRQICEERGWEVRNCHDWRKAEAYRAKIVNHDPANLVLSYE